MRIIPKKIKVKNTVWKCYSMADVIVALIVFAIIFIAVTAGQWAIAVILGLVAVGMFIPTPDGIFYTCVFENIKFLFAMKKYMASAKNAKESVDALVDLKEIKDSGLIVYRGGMYGRVIKIGQKNFGIEDVVQQNIDINYFANALKSIDQNQSADIVKIDRPVNLDGFAGELFTRLSAVKDSDEENGIKTIKENILRERIDRIDKLNNIRKQYLSDYYIVIYGSNELDLESTAVNVASEIAKCGLGTQLLGLRDTAVFLKYSFSRNFDEREIKELKDEELLDWVKPKEIVFHANKYKIDGTEAAVLAVSDYPLRVKNAWGAELFNIPNTKVVMHVKPVDKFKAIRRIDKVIGEMETKQIISDKASEANSAQTHRETMDTLLDALQTENESLFDVTLTVTAYNYTDNENYKKNTRRAMLTGNFRPSTLYGLQIEGFKSAAVSPVSTLKSQERGINSSSLAAAFPFVRTFVMDEGGILLGENNKSGFPFIFNMWKRGNLYQNSNAFVIGKSGAGKSYFLKNLILNEWTNGTRVIMLDPEAEYLALTRNLYGNVINVGNAREGRINPFHIYKILTEDGTPAEPRVTFNSHLKMLESFFKIVLADAPLDVIELINNLVVETYEKMGITENTDCSNFPADYFPLFSDLLETLQSKDKEKMDALTQRDMRTAELYLQKFVTGRYSDIWNAPSTLQVNANLIDFDFQSLFANKNNVVANAQMLLVFRFIEQEVINAREKNKNGANLRTLIIADEAHLYIDPKFPIALDFFYSMSKRIRKYNGSFIPATQNIADWNANEELRGKTSAIIKNSQYTFIFKLSAPDMKDVLDVYRAGDSFNDEEQRMIVSAVTGQAFFVGSTELRACVRIQAGKRARELFSEEKKRREKLKVKTRGILTGILFAVLIGLLALFIVFVPKTTTTASAATTPKYVVAFDYSANYTYGTGAGTSQYPSSGTGVYSATFRYGATGSNTVTASMYGSSAAGTGSFTSGDYIASSDVTVEVKSTSCKITVTIKNSSGTKIASGTNSASASGLSEGTYTVSMSGGGGGTINSRAGWSANFSGSFTFKIDQNAPTVNGASTSTTGKYANTAFTVSASDSGCGVKALYMKAPNNSTFYSVGTSTTVNKGSTNGRYTFYAEDNGGNTSNYYYVNFDDTPPTINCSGASFGSNTNAAFTVKAEDNSGSVTLYRKADDGSWTASGSSYTVSNSADDATYYFYAQDTYGNKSSEQWVQLGAELSGEFVKSSTDNSVYFTWDRSTWSATLDGSPYSKGTWIREEGEHIIKLSSNTKSAVYPYTIDHHYVESIENPTCTEAGYLQCACTQCGYTYTNYSIEETGHYYVASTTVATCTNGGYTVYTCTRCGDSYTDNYTNPLGHNYEATYMPATCTDYGKTVFTCQVCGSGYYETDGTYPTGHNYTNEIITAPTCTTDGLRRSTCESCGDTFDTKITANGHNYNITETTSTNGVTTRTYTCTVCGHSYKQELGDQYEEVSNYVEYLFEQYSPYIWWVLLATAGVWSIVMGVFFAIAQKNEDKEKSRKMLINYVIGLVVIAVIVVACPYLITGIASLIT